MRAAGRTGERRLRSQFYLAIGTVDGVGDDLRLGLYRVELWV